MGAVIAMVSLGFGVKEQIKDNISRLGSNLLIVQSGGRTATGARIQAGSGARLTDDDAKAIEKNIDGIKYVAPMVSRGYQLVVGNQNWTTNVQGSTPNIIDIRDYTVEEGRNINDHDMAGKDRVCVIGKTIVDNLFPDGDPIGKTIRINKAPFKVVGVLGAKGQSSGGQDQDDVVFVPLTTAMNRMMGITYVNNITIQAMNENVIDSVQAEVEHLLRIRHRIKNSDDDDFSVRNLAALMDTMMSTANTITMLLGCIAAISLLVGGIGIMNIMLVSVTERTREIGIRKAPSVPLQSGKLSSRFRSSSFPWYSLWVSAYSSVSIRHAKPRCWIPLKRCGMNKKEIYFLPAAVGGVCTGAGDSVVN